MNRIVPYVISVVLCIAPALCAQNGNGDGNGHDQQPPTQEQIDAWIVELRGEENATAIHNRLSDLGKMHAKVRAALYGLLADANVRPVLFEAVLSWMVNTNDRSAAGLRALMGATTSPSAERAEAALRQLEALDRRHRPSLLSELLVRLRDPKDANRKTWIDAAWLLAFDRATERADLTDALIAVLEQGAANGVDETVNRTLKRLTLRTLNGAAAWRSWYAAYVKANTKAGFEYDRLSADLLKSVEDSGTRVAIEAIGYFVAAGALPSAYVDPLKYPEPRVRRAAVDGLLKAAGEDAAKRDTAGKILVTVVRNDPDSEVRRLATRDLVTVVEGLGAGANGLRDQIAEALASRLEEPDLRTVGYAVRGIGRSGVRGKGYGDKLSAVYLRNGIGRSKEAAAVAVRTGIIEALSSLKEGMPTIVSGLADDDLEVRKRSALAIQEAGDGKYAGNLAEAWFATDDANTRRSFILAIEALQNYKPKPVTECLMQAVVKGEPETTIALRVLIQSLRAKEELRPGADQVGAIHGFLAGWIPTKPDAAKKQALIKDELADLDGAVGKIALAWAMVEADPKVRAALVSHFAGAIQKLPFTELETLAKKLEDGEAWADAAVLLGALVTRTGLGQAPEVESSKNAAFKLRHANALAQQGKFDDAEQIITAEITRQGTQAPYTLYRLRAGYRRAQSKNALALKDLEEALRRAGDNIPIPIKKAMLVEAAGLERDLGHTRAAYNRATVAEGLAAPGTDASRIRVDCGLQLGDPDVLDTVVDAYDKLVKAGGANLSDRLKKIADAHVAVRDLVARLDAGGATGGQAATDLKAADKKVVCPWLIRGLVDLASSDATLAAARARMALLHQIDAAAPEPPPATADAAAVKAVAVKAVSWWPKPK